MGAQDILCALFRLNKREEFDGKTEFATDSCSIAIREQWYGTELELRSIPIYFDHYNDDYILVLLKDGNLVIAYRINNNEVADEQSYENYQSRIRSLKEQLKNRKRRSWKK